MRSAKTVAWVALCGLLFGSWACSEENDTQPKTDLKVEVDMHKAPDRGTLMDNGATPDGNGTTPDKGPASDQTAGAFSLTSSDVQQGKAIDKKFSCQGSDISPALSWTNAPAGTKSFALIMDDPDAPSGTFVHWVLYDMPATLSSLKQNVAKTATVAGVGTQGKNGFGKLGYGGPCPPPGKAHRYNFTLYALSATLSGASGWTKAELLTKMQGKSLGTAKLMGTYQRQ